MGNKDIILSGKNIVKDYGGNIVLKGLDIDIYKGDFTIVMGASGSGKSTLLHILSGMDSVTSGEVFYKVRNIQRAAVARAVIGRPGRNDVNKKGKITAKSTGVCKININVCYKTAKNSRRRKKLMVNVSVKPKEDNGLQTFKIIINKKEFDAELYNTDAAKEFYKLLPMKIKMNELNGNEKFYYMDKAFTEDKGKAGTINTGDIMLYGNNCIMLFYETFQSNDTYTRIGYIKNPSGLAEELGKGDVEVSFSKQTMEKRL